MEMTEKLATDLCEADASKRNSLCPNKLRPHSGCAKQPCFLESARRRRIFELSEKQIPHLRVMGRNIRFLKSELEPFRAQFKQEVVNWQDQ